jgi:hypothetical protein
MEGVISCVAGHVGKLASRFKEVDAIKRQSKHQPKDGT